MPSPVSSEFEYMPNGQPHQLLTRLKPFDPSVLASTGVDLSNMVAAELRVGSELYNLVCGHLASDKSGRIRSFNIGIGSAKRGGCCASDDSDDAEQYRNTACELGLGVFEQMHNGEKIHILHQTLGEVVGTDCGATLLKSLVLLATTIDVITDYCDKLIEEADQTQDFKFNVFKFQVQHQYWRLSEVVEARPIESVVLPAALKQRVIDDLDEFTSRDSKKWYREHGIPYKRSYLLHGSPGAGKTSLIQALAGRYQRNVCFLSPSHPDFTDDALKTAVQRVPKNSIIVLEDIDGIGAAHRDQTKKGKGENSLTFSGMLNALDGVGGQHGQIFILTTNHRENLDPALIRNGRVDLHVEFTDATKEQMVGLFRSFYKDADATLAQSFATGLLELLKERTVSCAALQHYFIQMRKASAEQAAASFGKVVDEMEAHGKTKAVEEKKEAEDKAEEEGGQKNASSKAAEVEDGAADGSDGHDDAKKKKTGGGNVVHVHIH